MAIRTVLLLAALVSSTTAKRSVPVNRVTVNGADVHDAAEDRGLSASFARADGNSDGYLSLAELEAFASANATLEGHAAFGEDEESHSSCTRAPQTYGSKAQQREAFDGVRATLGVKDEGADDKCSREEGIGMSCQSASGGDIEKCTKRDVCLLMMEMDQRHFRKNQRLSEESAKKPELGLSAWSAEEEWYYSTYKLKDSMYVGGYAKNSASCSFGMQAYMFRKKWTSSPCARLMTYRGSDARLQEYRKIFMEKMSTEWCPAIWTDAISQDLACHAGFRQRDSKWALTVEACSNIPDMKLTEYETCGEACREPKWYGVGGGEIVTACDEVASECGSSSSDTCKEMKARIKTGIDESECKLWLEDLKRK